MDASPSPPPPVPGATRLTPLQTVLVMVLPALAVALLVELLLAAFGAGEPAGLSRGFDPDAGYVVPDPAVPGGFVTRIWDEKAELETAIPPRDGRTRVLLFGGSNTNLLPEQNLEQLLEEDASAAARDWEVINLGRDGYGSERVSILLAQAVARLQPDAVVIYSGHNEFVESAFALELEQGLSGAWLLGSLEHLRLFNALSHVLRPAPPPSSAVAQPLARAPPRAHEPTWRETLVFWEAYRQNLARMCDVAREAGVQVVLCTLVGNNLVSPSVSTFDPALDEEGRARFADLRHAGRAQIPEAFREGVLPSVRLQVRSWYQGQGASAPPPGYAPPVLRPLSGPLADMRATHGDRLKAESVEGAHWPDPAFWDEHVRAVLERTARLLAREVTPEQRDGLREAQRLLEEALALAPDHPDALFELGVVQWLLAEDDARAAATIHRAQASDRAPRAANDTTNAIVREVAAAHPEVELVDALQLFRSHTPDGLVGYEVMMDVCHLQPGARIVLLREVARALQRRLPR